MLVAVENTPSAHNLIVCTLCSCYPVAILGVSPAWYKSRAYRQALSRRLTGIRLPLHADTLTLASVLGVAALPQLLSGLPSRIGRELLLLR